MQFIGHGELQRFSSTGTWHVYHVAYGWCDTGYSVALPAWLVRLRMRQATQARLA